MQSTKRCVLFVAALLVVGTSVAWGQTPIYRYEVVNTYPHDYRAFTQGLILVDGTLYESTGLWVVDAARSRSGQGRPVININELEYINGE